MPRMNFGKHATINADGTGHTSEERLQLALSDPNNPQALKQGQVRAISQNRIRSAMAELAHGNIENVNKWIQTLAEGVFDPLTGKCIVLPQPKAAIDAFIELAQFSLPKLKAVAIDVRSSDGSVKQLSVSDLEKIVSEQ